MVRHVDGHCELRLHHVDGEARVSPDERGGHVSIATPVDAALADNTAVDGFLGLIYRVKLTTTGTYTGATTFAITAHFG
jgi:hypothetical protein